MSLGCDYSVRCYTICYLKSDIINLSHNILYMIGHKKDKHLIFFGQKQDKNMIFLGHKQDLNKNNGINHLTSNGIIEQHKSMDQYQPLGLNPVKITSKKSYLEK